MNGYMRGVCIQHVDLRKPEDLTAIWNRRESTRVSPLEAVREGASDIRAWRCDGLRRFIDPETGSEDLRPRGEIIILQQDYLAYSQLPELRDLPLFWIFARPKNLQKNHTRELLSTLGPVRAGFVQAKVDVLYGMMMAGENEAKRISLTKLIAKLDVDTQIATIWLNGKKREDIRFSRVFQEAFAKFNFSPATLGIRFWKEEKEGDVSLVNLYLDAYGNFTVSISDSDSFVDALSDLISYMRRLDLLRISLVDPADRGASFDRKVLG